MSESVPELRLRVPSSEEDVASGWLWAAGARAVEVVAASSDEPGGDAHNVELRTVLAATPAETRRVLGVVPANWSVDVVIVSAAPRDDWKHHVSPYWVDDEMVVVPSWGVAPTGARTVLWVDPGSSFGVGDHPSTRLSLRLLRNAPLSGRRVLDVGTGTGVLAIAASLSGASRVVGIDISHVAVSDAQKNVDRNRVAVELSATPLSAMDEVFDVVVANILAPTLVDLADDLVKRTAAGGALIVSGILDGSYDHVLSALDCMRVERVLVDSGWAAIVLRSAEVVA